MEFLALFKTDQFTEFSLNQWLRRLPVQMTEQTLKFNAAQIARIPDVSMNIIAADTTGSAARQK